MNTRLVKTKARRKNSELPPKPLVVAELRDPDRKGLPNWSAPQPLSIFRRIIE